MKFLKNNNGFVCDCGYHISEDTYNKLHNFDIDSYFCPLCKSLYFIDDKHM